MQFSFLEGIVNSTGIEHVSTIHEVVVYFYVIFHISHPLSSSTHQIWWVEEDKGWEIWKIT